MPRPHLWQVLWHPRSEPCNSPAKTFGAKFFNKCSTYCLDFCGTVYELKEIKSKSERASERETDSYTCVYRCVWAGMRVHKYKTLTVEILSRLKFRQCRRQMHHDISIPEHMLYLAYSRIWCWFSQLGLTSEEMQWMHKFEHIAIDCMDKKHGKFTCTFKHAYF